MTSRPARHVLVVASVAIFPLTAGFGAAAATDPFQTINAAAAADPVVATPLRGGVTMLSGSGGNIAVLKESSGLVMVDAGIAVSQAKIEAQLRKISSGPIRYVVSTHWHWDHTDGDSWVRKAGATVYASPQAIRRLKQTVHVDEWDHTFLPTPAAALPNATIQGDRVLRFGGERLRVRSYSGGHTDGDLSIYFEKADVLATGDTFWNGVYPFIDYAGGGGIDGAIREADANLKLAGPNTLIVPGHGPIGRRADLVAFRDMLVTVRSRVAALKAKGLTVDQAIAAHPTKDLDAHWGGSVINGDLFTRVVYRGV